LADQVDRIRDVRQRQTRWSKATYCVNRKRYRAGIRCVTIDVTASIASVAGYVLTRAKSHRTMYPGDVTEAVIEIGQTSGG